MNRVELAARVLSAIDLSVERAPDRATALVSLYDRAVEIVAGALEAPPDDGTEQVEIRPDKIPGLLRALSSYFASDDVEDPLVDGERTSYLLRRTAKELDSIPLV